MGIDCCGDNSFARGAFVPEEEIVVDGVVEENGLLRNDGNVPAQIGDPKRPYVVSVNRDAARSYFIETGHEVCDRRFPGPARSNKGANGAGRNGDGRVSERRLVVVVGTCDVVENDVSTKTVDFNRIHRVGYSIGLAHHRL